MVELRLNLDVVILNQPTIKQFSWQFESSKVFLVEDTTDKHIVKVTEKFNNILVHLI